MRGGCVVSPFWLWMSYLKRNIAIGSDMPKVLRCPCFVCPIHLKVGDKQNYVCAECDDRLIYLAQLAQDGNALADVTVKEENHDS